VHISAVSVIGFAEHDKLFGIREGQSLFVGLGKTNLRRPLGAF
jgi:hypothetical protein